MAAIGRSFVYTIATAQLVVFLHAGESSTPLARIQRVAESLSANNPAEAMAPFDRSYPDYEKLRNYFEGLAVAYQITNEATVLDRDESPNTVKFTLQWTITLTQANTPLSQQRTSKIEAVLVRKRGKWRIVKFSPIEIFDPAIYHPN
jgi:hypothetical protein